MNATLSRWTRGAALAAALALVGLAGCNKDDQYGLKFNHAQHVVDAELACTHCHGTATAKGFKAVDHDACVECHKDEVESDKITKDTCGYCHKVKDLEDISVAPPATGASHGVFVHTPALSNLCQTCHAPLLKPGQDRVPPMTRNAVLSMRDRGHALKMDCTACHVGMDPAAMPVSHDQNWTRRHGMPGEQDAELCSVCHKEESCRECHQTMEPQSHNTQWRLTTHGVQADWDRRRCQTCHEQDFCTSCHSEVQPRSHGAGWRQRHCDQCHSSPSQGTGCATCHEGSLETHPNPHAAGWNSRHCDTCHPGTPEEETCRACHPGTIADHVNPHGAGWATRHCNTCHAGSAEEEKCRECHPGNISDHVNPHGAGWSTQHCNNCHVGTAEEASCRVCHPGTIADHPNPHGAGWTTRHCDTCHPGTPEEEACRVCHPGSIATHPNPHGAGWSDRHCYNCHAGAEAQEECAICHEGGGSVLVHQSFWPPVHNRFGEQADCYYCHQP